MLTLGALKATCIACERRRNWSYHSEMDGHMRFSRYDPPYNSYAQWSQICQEGCWVRVAPSALSGLLPDAVLNKANSLMVMASGSPPASVFVANINRVDIPGGSALDQEPYIAAFDHSASAASGGFLHHGQWDNRTTYPDAGFFAAIAASGIQAYYPISEVPTAASGYLN